MDTAKLIILTETFKKQFNIERFKKFTREFFNEPKMMVERRHTGIWREYDSHIKSYYTIANYKDSDDNNLIVLAVELRKDSSIDRARSMQRNFISKILDENNMEAAIVAFYTENDPSWRLSFVKLDYSFKETGISLDLTPARRYSYLLGENEPNHTVLAQLLPIFENDQRNPTLDEIENSFSVEKVTKEFFSQYEVKYSQLKEYIEINPAFIAESKKLGFQVEKFSEQFAKKLMGQLAFLYFLQKKGWLGVQIMPKDNTLTETKFQEIYTDQDQAHRNVLDKVFKMTKDKNMKLSPKELFSIDDHEATLLSDCFTGTAYEMPWGSGDRTFIRERFDFCINNISENFFNDYLEPFFYEALNSKRNNQYFKRFNCKIPFLNGGLFEPLEGYHWKDVNFEIPNDLFSNKEQKGREADGILDIFDRFNFTINEDEPLEKEVAVDPEMLGKIFENLLDASDRKSKGAFYTPREIVHYMCQESLINYLVNEANVPYEDMEQFILYGELIRDADSRRNVGYGKEFSIKRSIYDNIVKIDEALQNVKVADPAVGSGAFPLGMLNEIVKARNNITDYIIRKDKEGFFDRKYGEDFIRKRRAPYKMKWDTIKNCIFAVDIEPSAVDIAKLRLWLSVVVEQEINAENSEPHPLPNLDMNILVGNSLIDEYEGIKLFDKSILSKKNKGNETRATSKPIQMSLLIDYTEDILKEMFDLQDRYFDEDNEERKTDIKGKIDKIRDELIRYKLQRDNNIDALKRYEESLKNEGKPYFIWEMEFAKIFKDKGGFDIVIGNPPYVQIKQIPWEDRKLFERKFQSAVGRFNLFYFFLERASYLATDKGVTSFIVPDRLLLNTQCSELRKWLLNEQNILNLISFDESVFSDAVVDSIIISYSNHARYADEIKTKDRVLLRNLFEKPYVNIPVTHFKNSYNNQFGLNFDNRVTALLEKIKSKSVTLGEIAEVKDGIIQGKVEDLLFIKQELDDCSKPLLFGRNIVKYKITFNNNWVNYKPDELMKVEVERRGIGVRHGLWMRNPHIFEHNKILTRQTADEIIAAYDTDCYYYANTLHGTTITDSNYMPEYVLGVLNSGLTTWYYRTTTAEEGKVFAQIKIVLLRQMPIFKAEKNLQQQVADIVKEIHELSQQGISDFKSKILLIDELLYEVYGLSNSEISLMNSKEE